VRQRMSHRILVTTMDGRGTPNSQAFGNPKPDLSGTEGLHSRELGADGLDIQSEIWHNWAC